MDCPLCLEPVLEGARQCDNCGADLTSSLAAGPPESVKPEPSGTPDSEAPSTPTAVETSPLRDAGRQGPDPSGESAKSFLYLCPSCGELVRAEDASCAKCGVSLREDVRPAVPELKREEPPEAKAIQTCRQCGAEVPAGQQQCGVCGTSVAIPVDAPEPREEPAAPQAISKDEQLAQLEEQFAREVAAQRVEHAAPEEPPAPVRTPEIIRRATTPAPRAREPRTVPNSLATWREYAAIMTALATPVTAIFAVARVPGNEWGQLLLFSVLFGIGLNLTIPAALRVARSTPFLAWVGGTAGLLTVPAFALTGSPLSTSISLLLLAASGGIIAFASSRLPRHVSPFLPWLSGLLLLTTAAVVSVASLTFGDPVVGSAIWLVGGALAVGPAAFVGYRVVMTSRASGRLALAEAALSNRDPASALALYDEALQFARRAGRDLETALYGKGAALVAAGKPDEALELLDRALSTNPRNEVAWVNKGSALTRMGRLQDALKCYNSAIKVNAEYEVAWNNKGNALSRLGRHEWALQCYEQALSLDPAYRTAWVNKGYVLAKLGRFDEAAECADRALKLTSGAPA